MGEAAHATVKAILEEFDGDPEALATEVLALRRVVEELRSLHADEPGEPFVIFSPAHELPETAPTEPRPMPPRMTSA